MIPLAVGAIAIGLMTAEIMTYAATAGAGHALGRKYGRIICHKLDQVETVLKSSIDKFK
jgi:hypothetical protein|tara:strand:+ start:493 stop:669 length:177 start_codon:yes stop_codon:yes gene_type:complete